MRMNYLLIVVGITIVSLLLASPFFLQTQNAYERAIFGQGYNVELSVDSDEATEQEEEAIEEAEENEDNDD
jgi:DNA-binding LacI/PurR family transcriptional regulator